MIKSIGNWATFLGNGRCSCGWMDLHIDEPCGYEKGPYWTINPIEIHPDAVFVHRVGGVYVIEELKPNVHVSFRFDRWHGLLPREIAKELAGKRVWKHCKPYVEWFKETLPDTYYHSRSTEQNTVRLIWEFIDEIDLGIRQ